MNFDFEQSNRASNHVHTHHHSSSTVANSSVSSIMSSVTSSVPCTVNSSSTSHLHQHHHHLFNHHNPPQSTGRKIRLINRGSSLDTDLIASTGVSLDGGLDNVDSQDDLLYTIKMGHNLNQIDIGSKFRTVSSLSENSSQLKNINNNNINNNNNNNINSNNNNNNNIKSTIFGRNISTLPNNLQRISANGQSKSAMSFRFSTDEISQFKAELGSSICDLGENGRGGGGCSTRATTPGEEHLVQEPVESLQIRIGRLLSNEEMADMHFIVSGCSGQTGSTGNGSSTLSPISRKLRIPAHRIIMATASPWFRELLLNPATNRLRNLDENEERISCIEVSDIEAGSFLEFLRYVYTDVARLTKDNCVGVLIAGRRYEMTCLEQLCIQYIQNCLSKKSALAIWNSARHYGDIELENVARRSVTHFADDILLSYDFIKLDQASLFELLSDDALRADEIVIFRALTRWAKQNCHKAGIVPTRANVRAAIGSALNLIRFPLMTEEQLQRIVAAEGILEDELIRALVHCSRSWSKIPGTSLHSQPPQAFSSESRTYQKLRGKLLSVYRFASFEGTAVNRITTRTLNFLTNRRVWLAGIGLYAPRKACTFYLNVNVRVRRSDNGCRTWISPLDYIEHTLLLKFDGSDHIINVHFDEPLQVEANVQYIIVGSITPTTRSTSLVKAKLHPHLYYTRPNDVNFYYGTEGQYATKVRLSSDDSGPGSNHRPENVIFNFDWERSTFGLGHGNDDNSSDSFGSNNGVLQCFPGSGAGGANSEPTTPAPPPRPPPPQEYKRPSRMQRLRRAFSFIDRREDSTDSTINSKLSNGLRTDSAGNGNTSRSQNWDTVLLEGQIPLLMFYA